MKPDDKKRIQVNWVKLVEDLQYAVGPVCDRLMAEGVIDNEEREDICELPKTSKTRVRTLLHTLMKKNRPDVLEVFCDSMAEAGTVYVHLIESIRDADISSVADVDLVDSRDGASQKQGALVDAVLRQSDELIKVNEDYRREIAKLKEINEVLVKRQSCLTALENSGFTDKSLLQFVDVFVLARNIGNNTAHARGVVENFPYPDILKKMSPEMHQDQLKVCLLSIYIVHHVVTAECRYKLPNSFQCYATSFSDKVDETTREHPQLFDSSLRQLHVVEMDGLNTFDAVADEMFLDGVCNWGRIISWFAFCACLAKHFPGDTLSDTLDIYAIFSWFYINKRMCDWIEKAGGWVCNALVSASVMYYL